MKKPAASPRRSAPGCPRRPGGAGHRRRSPRGIPTSTARWCSRSGPGAARSRPRRSPLSPRLHAVALGEEILEPAGNGEDHRDHDDHQHERIEPRRQRGDRQSHGRDLAEVSSPCRRATPASTRLADPAATGAARRPPRAGRSRPWPTRGTRPASSARRPARSRTACPRGGPATRPPVWSSHDAWPGTRPPGRRRRRRRTRSPRATSSRRGPC